MKPIFLATDGSPSAAEATLHAVELARALDTSLVAVAVEHVDVRGGPEVLLDPAATQSEAAVK